MYRLQGVIQPYSWGGFQFIPRLLARDTTAETPAAEYWLGAHPNHPAHVEDAVFPDLQSLITADPQRWLGAPIAEQFGSLPYLLKVLDVRQMLSIQVHPSKASAEEGYEKEDRMGIAVNAPNRNYKDRNHKPEIMVALSDFYLLHGFKPAEELVKTLMSVPELEQLLPLFRDGGYRGLYERVMELDSDGVNVMLQPLVDRILPLYRSGTLSKEDPSFWAARAVETFCKEGNLDRGIFSVYFFNLHHLERGEGIYQAAGLPHAYLEGQNVEVMANSDNVLRAGLTDKYVDVPELMKHVRFEPTVANVLRPERGPHRVFHSPAEEFEVHEYSLSADADLSETSRTAEILLCIEGEGLVAADGRSEALKQGVALLLQAGQHFTLKTQGNLHLFRVTVPEGGKKGLA